MKVLIIIDPQNDFIDGSLGTKEAQSAIPSIVKKINGWNGLIFVTKDTHYNSGSRMYEKTLEGQLLPVPHCMVNTPGWNINPEINKALNCKDSVDIYLKSTFGGLDMVNTLRSGIHFVESFEICGFCTDICVVSNALLLRAAFPDIPIMCDSSCCAGTTLQNHEAALTVMRACQINVVNI